MESLERSWFSGGTGGREEEERPGRGRTAPWTPALPSPQPPQLGLGMEKPGAGGGGV